MVERQRLIVGPSGSSAPQLGDALLEALGKTPDVETHLVISSGAGKTIEAEMGLGRADVEAPAPPMCV